MHSSFSGRVLVLFIFLAVLLIGSAPVQAKKKEAGQKEPVNFQDLSPSKKLEALSQMIWTGRISEAFDRLAEVGNLKLDSKHKNRLNFIRAYLFLTTEKAEEASQLFEGLNGKYPEIAPVLPYWLARSQRLGGNPQKALATLEKACGGECVGPGRMAREYASALCEGGQREKALSLFAAFAQGNGSEALRLDQIECKMKSGDTLEAYTELRQIYTQAPIGIGKNRLESLLKTLHKNQSSVPSEFSGDDQLSRISTLKLKDRWVEAAEEFKALWPRLSPTSQASLRQEAAEAFFKARAYREAAEQYEILSQSSSEMGVPEDSLEKLASAYARSNQFDKAIEAQRRLNSLSDGNSSVRSYKIAFLFADAGRCEEAVKAFDEFLLQFPQNNKRDDALWQKAWCEYQLRRYDAALATLEQLKAEFPRGAYAQRASYWTYRILDAAGRGSAREARQQFAAKYGESFHQRWEEKQGKGRDTQCPITSSYVSSPKIEKASLDSLFPGRSKEDSILLRELLVLGLWEDFLETYRPSGESPPLRLEEWIPLFADMEQVPTELVWAVMREESRFKSSATSNAGALGLMQIIPQTGFEIAQSLKQSQFNSEELFDPLINLRFGVHYLGLLLKKFSGNMVQAIASYNAGPEAVERWRGQKPGRPCDEFIEEIPYRETHNYVMKVMKSFWNYRDSPPNGQQIANQ